MCDCLHDGFPPHAPCHQDDLASPPFRPGDITFCVSEEGLTGLSSVAQKRAYASLRHPPFLKAHSRQTTAMGFFTNGDRPGPIVKNDDGGQHRQK